MHHYHYSLFTAWSMQWDTDENKRHCEDLIAFLENPVELEKLFELLYKMAEFNISVLKPICF